MKRLNVLLVSGLLYLVASCNVAEEVISELEIGPEPRIVEGKVVKKIYTQEESDSSVFEISYAFFSRQFSSDLMDSTYKDSVNSLIYKRVLNETHGYNRPVENLTRHFFKSRLDTLEQSYFFERDEYSNLWELEMSIWITDYKSCVKLSMSSWSYTGGAHGNGYLTYQMIDREDGSTLGIADFFTDMDQLNAICEPYFRELFKLSVEESLNEYGFWFENDEFTVNENFTFTGDNVIFYYNTYEIAPYAGGPTELIVPMDKIKHLLKREI